MGRAAGHTAPVRGGEAACQQGHVAGTQTQTGGEAAAAGGDVDVADMII